MAIQVHKLTEAAVEKAKKSEARREIPDGGGLFLVVHPTGLKTWAVRYRRDGKPRKYTIPGSYPSIDLKAARSAAKAALRKVADGGDPAADKVRARVLAADLSTDFPTVVGEFLDKCLTRKKQRPRPRSLEQLAWVLGVEKIDEDWKPRKGGLAERWRSKKVTDITDADVRGILDAEVDRGVPILANRMWAILRWFFSWCLRRKRIAANPVAGVEQPAPEPDGRKRYLSDDELRLFWHACGEHGVHGAMSRILALTGVRLEMARAATWGEIDTDKALWTVPASREGTKGKDYEVPLSRLALDILAAQPRIGSKPGYVFTTTGKNMLGDLSGAKKRLDRRMLELARETNPDATIPNWTRHTLRHTLKTWMQKARIPKDVRNAVQNHSDHDMDEWYGHYTFEAEKRAALDAWARHIEAITSDKPSNVVEMRAAR